MWSMADPTAVKAALSAVLAEDRGRLMAALVARFGDFQLAEDALQEAATAALLHWGRSGLPHAPLGWLLTVAGRKAIDRLRLLQRDGVRNAALSVLAAPEAEEEAEMIPDHRLRLIYTCCHPALDPKSRVALTLRTLCGLPPAEIARAFLENEPTMGQRLSRAKAKIAAARIPFRLPEPEDLPGRLNSVLTVIYLIFNAGYTAGPEANRDLGDEALFLARLLNDLRPAEAEVEGCLALLLLTHARRAARIGADGASVALADQDRHLWDTAMLSEGRGVLDAALARARPGPFQIKAAIAALHAAPGGADWPQIAALYAALHDFEPSPVIMLNHAVAMTEAQWAEGQGAEVGIARIDALGAELEGYQPYHAARAEYLFRLDRVAESRAAYDRAIALAPSDADRAFLTRRRARLVENPAG